MAGHSKWANIKHRKGAQDAKRAKIFTKVAREIMVSARESGPDPASNPRLRSAIASARAVNMPNERIDKAIKKGTGEGSEASFEEIVYEGYGPSGVAVYVNVLTDNRNRTASEIRHLFSKSGGELGTPGSVAWMFDRKGLIAVPADAIGEDELFELVAEAGAEEIERTEETYDITTAPEDLAAVRDALEAREIPMSTCELAMIPQNTVPVDGEKAQTVLSLLEALDDHDDVQKVAANCDIQEEA